MRYNSLQNDNPPPEVGLSGHLKFTDEFGKGWAKDTNKKLDDWLKKRGIKSENNFGKFNFGNEGTPRDTEPEQLPNVGKVPGLGQRQEGKPSDVKGHNAPRSVPRTHRESKRGE